MHSQSIIGIGQPVTYHRYGAVIPVADRTAKDTTGTAKLRGIPFGVLVARGGKHTAIVMSGKVYEARWESDARETARPTGRRGNGRRRSRAPSSPPWAGKRGRGRFKFNQIDRVRTAREIRPAVEALEKAGVIRLVHHTPGQGVPLAVDSNPRISKLFFLDVGLMHASLNIDADFVQEPDLLSIHRGAVAEQFVAQEMLACAPPDREPELWFWTREAPNSQAEVDFLIPRGNGTGTHRSEGGSVRETEKPSLVPGFA